MTLKLLHRKQNNISFNFIPLGGSFKPPYIFILGNSNTKGTILIKYNLEENSANRGRLSIKNSKNKFINF